MVACKTIVQTSIASISDVKIAPSNIFRKIRTSENLVNQGIHHLGCFSDTAMDIADTVVIIGIEISSFIDILDASRGSLLLHKFSAKIYIEGQTQVRSFSMPVGTLL